MKNSLQFVTSPLGAALATIVFTFSSAQAGTIWDGGGNATTNIDTAVNWDGDTLPVTLTDGTQILTFGTAGANATINTDVNVSGLVFNRDAAFALNSGAGNLTIGTGGITNNASAITASRTYTINEGVILNGNQTWSVNNKDGSILGALSVGGVVSGSSAITKTGNGTLTLSANNTYSGGTILRGTGSRITVSHISGLGSGNVTIESTGLPSANTGAFVALNTNGIYANNFTISGQGTANGAIQSLASNATLSGLVTLAGDSMIATRTAAGNGKLFITGGITSGGANRTLTLNTFGNATISSNEITISTNSVNLGSGGTLDIGHGIQAGGLGTFNLNVGGNTWGTTIVRASTSAGVSNNATLNLGAANALGSSTSILQLGAGTTALEGITVNLNGNSQTIGGLRSFTGSGSLSANGTRTVTSATAATLTIDNSSGTSYLYDGVISGNLSLTKSGSATQTLTRNNTYTGETTVNAGVLNIRANDALGTTTGGTSVASGASLQLQGDITVGAEALSLSGSGVSDLGALRNISGNNTYGGAITLAGASRINSDVGTLTLSGGISGAQNLTVGGANNTTISGAMNLSSGSFTKDGAGSVTLSQANTYTGGTTLINSNLIMGANNAIGNGALTFNAINTARLNINSTNQTITGLTVLGATASVIQNEAAGGGTGSVTFNIADGVTSSSASNFQFRDSSTGAAGLGKLALVKTGNGTLDFSTVGATNYSGGLTVNQGVFSYSATAALGSASNLITLGGGTLNYTGASGSSVSTTNTNMSLAAGTTSTLNNANGTVTISANIAGSGNLNKSGAGTVVLSSNSSSYSGAISVNEGVLNIRANNALGTTAGGTSVASGAVLQVQGGITVSDDLNLSGGGVSTTGALRSISGDNTWAGDITIGSSNTRIASDAGLLTISGNINGAAGTSPLFQGAGNITVSGIISGGTSIVTSAGLGANSVLRLSGNNTNTGSTLLNGGALLVTSTGSLASGNALTIANGNATAEFANAGQTLGAVSNANSASNALNFSASTGTVTLASLSGAGNTRFGSDAVVTGGISTGTINAVGSLTANITGGTVGAGSLTAGSVSGGTTTVGGVATIGTMSAGTANLNGATSAITTLSGGSIALGSSTVLSVSGGSSSGVISGGGSLNKTGASALELLGVNTYTGGTTVSEGTLTVNGSLASGVTVSNGATLGGNGTISGNSTIAGSLNPGNSPGLLTFANSVTLQSTATTTMEIVGNSTPSRGVTYDAIDVGGDLVYGGTLTLDFSGPAYGDGVYNFNLFDFNTQSGSFTSMSLAGIYSGSFTNTSNSSILSITQGDNTWSFNQGDGVLTFTVVPEPNVAMVVGSLMLMGLLRRRRD
jgi:fibronectin-binding autotransporter adhesin